jgi:integrase
VTPVKGPRQCRGPEVRPLSPESVEAIRAVLPKRDATLVSLLAYAGLRPAEALALAWEPVRRNTLLIEGSISVEGTTKTGRNRTVRLLRPVAQDLAE